MIKNWRLLAAAAGIAVVGLGSGRVLGVEGMVSEQIIVDQFGWRPGDHKVVIFANAIKGQGSHYEPGKTFEIRRVGDDGVAFSGSVAQWHGGATDDVSGDQTWSGDFSELRSPGQYYVFDPGHHLRSFPFRIEAGVYDEVLKAAMRMYYYQRTGTAIPEKFGGHWNHALDHMGPTQDRGAKLWKDEKPVPDSPARELSGGWFDAGDFNKYVPFTQTVLWNLLTAYEWNPGAFRDDSNIPESGNGVPDALDEIKYELDWMLKMQNPDGSVLNRDSNPTYAAGHADPSTDTQPRYYTQATTWATASFAASIAHGARVFTKFDSVYPGYSKKLQNAAEKAWGFLEAHPTMWPEDGTDHGKGLASAPGSGSV